MRRISVLAVLFLVLLRIAIGWQFLYEGLWKYDTLKTASPWTAKGYLANAEGPLRDKYRSMVGDFPGPGDPDDLRWLDYQTVSDAWDRWVLRFTDHYGLDDAQKGKLEQLINGAPEWSYPVKELPPGVREKLTALQETRKKAPDADLPDLSYADGKLVLSGKTPLKPDEVTRMYGWVGTVLVDRLEEGKLKPTFAKADDKGQAVVDKNNEPVRLENGPEKDFATAVLYFSKASGSGLGFRQRLLASLKGDPERTGVYKLPNTPGFTMGTPPDPKLREAELVRYGEIQKYRDELAAYNAAHRVAKMPHEFDHLARLKTKLEGLKRAAVGPVKALDTELKETARALLTPAQIARGPVKEEATPLSQASERAMWALLVLGALLILGLFSRLAALGGAVLLLSFYLVVPPWPGVPEPATTEHALFINKNLIEVIALFGLAALPTGSWFGLDGIFRWLFRSRA